MNREPSKPANKTPVFKALPEIWQLIQPRRGLLALGFGLMVINRVSGLVLPASTKYLVDDIIGKRHYQLLYPLVGLVLSATIIQGLTSFALTQTLSKAAQRLITELRRRVQEHIGRLSVSYYDSNKTGTMVARIMSDVEGVRNLVGTGLVDFVGGLLTAVIAFAVLMRISPIMTMIAFGFLLVFGVGLRKAFKTIRPIFRERVEDQRRGYRTTDRVAGRRAGGEGLSRRRARTCGVQRGRRAPAAERVQDADRNLGDEPDFLHLDGSHRRDRDVHGNAPDPGGQADAGRLLHLHDVPRAISPRRCFRWWESARRLPRPSPGWSAPARC